MNMMKLLPLLIGMTMLFLPATQTASAQYYGSGEPSSISQLQQIPGMVRTVVQTIDQCFSILSSAQNLNAALRNAGLALTVGFNGLIDAGWQTVYMGVMGCLVGLIFPIPIISSCVLGPIAAILSLLVHVLVALFNALEAFTRTY